MRNDGEEIMKMLSVLKCCVAATGLLAATAVASAQETITVGIYAATSDAPLFIADKKGFFREEGIAVKLTSFQSAAMMVPPLGTGQLDVGAGSASAGLYNAVGRGIKIKIVADKASSPPGYGATKLIVRKDHVDGGRYKTFKDFKGMKFGMNAPGVSNTALLNAALKSVGLKYSDVETVDFKSPMDHVTALKNKSVDAAASIEPAPTLAVENGDAVVVGPDDVVYPNHQIAVLLYSEAFAAKTELATKFMRAYLRAVRFYNDALKDSRLAGSTASELISIMTEYTPVKAEIYRKVTPTGMNPDGNVNMASLESDLAFYTEQGLVKEKVKVDQIVDLSFAKAAVKTLGPYKKQ
jgi:NitT/TauT family transport system substrate-binding protein